MNLMNHKRMPPYFGLVNRAYQRQIGLFDWIILWVAHIAQQPAQRVADFPARTRRVEKQLVGFVVQFGARFTAHIAEEVQIPILAERIKGADEVTEWSAGRYSTVRAAAG